MKTFSQVADKVAELFGSNGTLFAAAMNEVNTAQAYPACLDAIDSEYPELSPFDSLLEWCIRRAKIWS